MKVLMPTLHYYPVIGGLETWTQNIAERLSDKAEIFVVTGRVKDQPVQEVKNGVKIFRTSLFSLKNLSYSSPIYIFTALPFIFFKSLFLIKNIRTFERSNNSNILLHCQGLLSALLGLCLGKLTDNSYVVTVQSLEKRGFLEKMAYRNAAFCIAVSSAVKEYFQGIGVKNIAVIPNGIDLRKFENLDRVSARQKLGLNSEFMVMTIARLEKVKGIEYLIKAVVDIRYQPTRLLIIGDGSERGKLKKLVEGLNLESRVKFLGQIPNEKIPEYLAAADCFVLPSLKEGFGIAILEAQAAGVPVIGTKVGGILDIIGDQKTGILVEPGNSEAIAEAIYKIYSNPDFTRQLTQNAKANLEKYDWDKIAEKVYSIYQNI